MGGGRAQSFGFGGDSKLKLHERSLFAKVLVVHEEAPQEEDRKLLGRPVPILE